jgi:RHS repeat-associated protein
MFLRILISALALVASVSQAGIQRGFQWGGFYVSPTPDTFTACTNVGGQFAFGNNCIFSTGEMACQAVADQWQGSSYSVYEFVSHGVPYTDPFGNAVDLSICVFRRKGDLVTKFTTNGSAYPFITAGAVARCIRNGVPDAIWGSPDIVCPVDKPPIPICPVPDAGKLFGNPILPATGEKIKLQTDFTDNAPHGLDFSRTYRTAWGDVSPASGMGSHWNHRFGMQLVSVGTTNLSKTLQMPDGSQRRFTRTATTLPWVNTDGTDQLFENTAGYLFTNAQNDDKWQFNALGKPVTLTQRNGWVYLLAYNPSGQLVTVTNRFGRQLALTYNASNLLSGVAAPDGQQISYQYNSGSSLIYAGYGTNSTPNTSSIQYLYETPTFPKALTGMVDENGVRSATYAYDAQGRAISSELAGGADKYQVSYGSSTTAGSLNTSATITDPLGTARNYTYSNTAGSLAVTAANVTSNGQMPGTDAASRVQNASGLIDSETDYLGVQTMYTWDMTRKLPLSTTRAAGRPEAQTTHTTWHATLRLPLQITETGRTTNYTYDAVGNRLSQSIVDTVTGQVKTTAWTYNPQGLVATETTPNGGVTTYTYDTAGNPATVKNALNQVTSYQHDAAGRMTREQAPNGLVTTYAYDAKGRLLTMNRGGLISSYTYTPSGQLATSTQPNGHQTTYTYDSAQRLTGWADNRGASGVYTLDAIGNRTAEQIKNSAGPNAGNIAWQTVRSINNVNRVTSETVGTTGSTVANGMVYNANGDLVQESNGLGQTTTYALDGLKRLAAITNAQNASAQIAYDKLDNVVAASDFKGMTTSYDRDAAGNAKQTHSNDAGLHAAQYDALGLPTSVTDALGQATSIQRDLLGRPTLITYADDANSATARTTTITYSNAGFASVITDPAAKTTYIRDPLGRVTRKTQLLTSGANSVVNYTYVPAGTAANVGGGGQLNSMSYPNGGILSYVYSASGQLSGLNWATSATAAALPLISNITWSPLGQPLTWNWDFADAPGATIPLGTASIPTTQTAARTFDTAGRMTANEFASYTYDPAGRITQIIQTLTKPTLNTNGTVTTGAAATAAPFTQVPVTFNVTYDPVGRITAFTQSGTATVSTPINSVTFTYDANGNRQTSVQATTTLTKTGGTTAAPILTPSTQTTTRTYQIDPTGNKLLGFSQTMTQTGGAANGATSNATVNYTYDANGALLTDGLRHYAYDSEGRLAAASLGWSNSSTADDSITKYAHNSQAQRVFKTAPLYAVTNPEEAAPQSVLDAFAAFFESLWSPSTNPDGTTVQKAGMSYVYDEDGTLIADTLTGGATTAWGQSAKYIYLPTAAGPMPVAAIYGTKHYAIQSDHLNTPRRLIQSDGQVAWQWAYSAFGEEKPTIAKNRFANVELNQSFGTTSVPAVTFNLRYPGQYFDQETNLHYNYHRSYSATTGRYTQADPIGLDGGWNIFGYVDSDPLSDTDPLGLNRSRGNANRPSTPILRPPPRPISLQPFSTYSTESMSQCGVCMQIYFIARLNGEQSGHRTIANNQFYQYLSSGASPLNARQVQRQMSSGSSGLLNPTGYEWHHPVGRPNEIWLVTRCDHRDSLLRPFIHPLPGGGGGFSENFPGGYR